MADLANSIKEALNLDISSDTKENIDQILDAVVSNIKKEELPEELQTKIETAATDIKDAKEKYDNAVANGDTAAAEEAQEDFNTCLLYTSPSPRDRG